MRVNLRSYLLARDQRHNEPSPKRPSTRANSLARLLQHYGDELISDDRDRGCYTDYRELRRNGASGPKNDIAREQRATG